MYKKCNNHILDIFLFREDGVACPTFDQGVGVCFTAGVSVRDHCTPTMWRGAPSAPVKKNADRRPDSPYAFNPYNLITHSLFQTSQHFHKNRDV